MTLTYRRLELEVLKPLALALLFATAQRPMRGAEQNQKAVVTETGIVTTLAGSAGTGGHLDGTGPEALFLSPKGMSTDSEGNVYTMDSYCGTLRKITPTGTVTTLAGPATGCVFGSADGIGNAARFNSPSGTAVDRVGNIYVADSGNCTLRKVTPTGVVTTVAGSPSVCVAVDGPRSVARFNPLAGVTLDAAGNIYVTSWYDCTVREVTQSGEVSTVAGVAGLCGSVDGVQSGARFANPSGIAAGEDGNFFIADETGCAIRKMTSRGVVTTLAGQTGNCGSADGAGKAAQFNVPSWTAVDEQGNIYVTDYLNFTVRQVSPNGVVTTLAGVAGTSGSADGQGAGALFNHPDGVAVDKTGNVYIADRNNNTVRKIIIPNKVHP